MYRAIIFDYFDVIRTDVYKAWLIAHGYSREGFFADIVEQMDRGEISLEEFLARLGDRSDQSADEIFAEMKASAKVDHDIVAMIEQLHDSYKLGLLSNAPSNFIRSLLREDDIERHFDEIIISSEVGMTKPNPEIFQLILGRLQVPASEALFIDDNENHIRASEAIGIKGVVYTNATALKAELIRLGIR